MRILSSFCAALMLMLASGSHAMAQTAEPPATPEHLAVATDVLKASGLMTMFENAMPNVVGPLRANMTRQRPELTRDIEEALKVVEAKTAEATGEGVATAAQLLAKRMNEAELREVYAFLSSPVGKKYVATLPAFMEEIVPFLEQWNQSTSAGLTRVFQQEMLKRGHKL